MNPIHKIFTDIVAVLTTVIGVVLNFLKQAQPALKKMNEGLSHLEAAKAKLQLLAEQKREEDNRMLDLKRQEIQTLDEQRLLAEKEQLRLENQLHVIEQEIREIEEGRGLENFIRKRINSQDYEKQLGIISAIRKDFQELSEKITRSEGGELTEKIDRIILYIDDLDRCPPDKVMEVLQAIHLILAFRLFIVVVGVDVRWISQSIREKFPFLSISPLENPDEQIVLSTPPIGTLTGATTFDYLEKIFQIGYTLRQMDTFGVINMVQQMVGKPAGDTPQIAGDRARQPTGVGEKTEVYIPQTAPSNQPAFKTLPRYKEMEINAYEENVICQFAPLFASSPRAVKRFINIFRLLKVHEKGPVSKSEIKTMILLLGIIVCTPEIALSFFNLIIASGADNFLDAYQKVKEK